MDRNTQEYPSGGGGGSHSGSMVQLTSGQVCDSCQLWLKWVNDKERLPSQPAPCHELRSMRGRGGSCVVCDFVAHTAVGRRDCVRTPRVPPWDEEAGWRNGDWLNMNFLFDDTSWEHPRGSLRVDFRHDDTRRDPISPRGCIRWESRVRIALNAQFHL